MTPPARREGTPDRGADKQARPTKKTPDEKLRLSNAKPAKKQHVSLSQRQRAAQAGNSDGASQATLPADHPLADNWWDAPTGGQPAKKGLSKSPNADVRLQKALAQAGVASRRHAELMIDEGRVEVNGTIVREQGVRVDPNVDIIRVDGVRVNVNEDLQYFVLNKPRGMHTTMEDELGRPCVGDIVADRVTAGQRLFHVGRLDADTEGLLILTNDGELANRLMHPKYEVPKTYLATVKGEAKPGLVKQLRAGIELEDGMAKADYVNIVDTHQGESLILVELHEGRKHIVRRMLKAAGFPVQRLVRTKIHTVRLGEQKPGTLRALNDSELTSLYKVVEM
ncbi:pseudouridine synthase [Corynebacterium aquatimens]|uniref:Pseudouridine synthase n=1 Tax=Corynebacterium aquatimens TaxID=1190508 RepID=A0A931E0D9_9CORY|nr:pseudouridine synthase [Corynebacterium aquatimens]MBG6121552.1 23S rRNA pseudouridine2605 synthase [Corynebacterium aquatimens]WJY65907.1 Ribosomal large subunit pseudouridine synthase B [Corynebacterium aquatimens]